MNWLDCFSLVADVVTVVGIPSLLYANRQLWKQYQESHRARIVSENCLEFLAPGRAINLVPLETLSVLPRVGEIVDLPAETGAESEIGSYRVERIDHVFVRSSEDQMRQPVQAVLGKVIARVSRVSA
jgi:hypothetical protein